MNRVSRRSLLGGAVRLAVAAPIVALLGANVAAAPPAQHTATTTTKMIQVGEDTYRITIVWSPSDAAL